MAVPAVSARSAPLLVRRTPAGPIRPRWDDNARTVLNHRGGFLRVLGGPGTGKTTLIADLVADRVLRRDADPENILVLTANRKAATGLRARIATLLTTDHPAGLRTAREPLVRTVHSYAFGVLRLKAALRGTPPPRLLSGPDQDAVVRELLAGDLEDGADYWPARLRPALGLPAFAAELRDLLLRAAERGLGPEELIQLGRARGRDEWVAAGVFGRQYEQVNLLRGGVGGESAAMAAPVLDAAELVDTALLEFELDDDLAATERARVRHLIVDDAQHLDPRQFELIRMLGESAEEWLLFGDPDQSVFSFRGADPTLLADADEDGEHTVVLHTDHRMAPAIRAAVDRITAHLPGAGPHRELQSPKVQENQDDEGRVTVRLFASAAQEAGWVADQFRRAHLLDGVPWSRMAVLVRSAVLALPVLRRALLAAGVPIAAHADTVPLIRHPVVRPFLELLRVADAELDEDTATALLAGPLGGADPLVLRRLRRGLRRLEIASGGDRSSGELLIEALESGDALAALDEGAVGPVRQVAALLTIARDAVAEGMDVERALWELWTASGLERRLAARSARGGPVGAQADRDLDAVLVLFDEAARYTERQVGGGIDGFVEYLAAQRIVGDTLAPSAPDGDAVSVLTVHAAAGREWTVVAVPGVQEGIWPDLRLRGSLLGVEKLVDVLSGVEPDDQVSATAPLLAEERRLLRVAASRARRTLLVSAVRGEDEQPSRFLDELDGTDADPEAAVRPVLPPSRSLVLADVVGELRRVVCSEGEDNEDDERRSRAARQLARLAKAGVPGADPRSWYGIHAPSSDRPLWTDEDQVRVSPSTIELLTRCSLRWLVERHGGTDTAELPSITGSLVHALAQAAAEGADPDQLRAALDTAWESVDAGAPWFSRRERARVERMVDAFRAWLAASRSELTQLAVEWGLDVKVPPSKQKGGPWLRVRGRVDRLETDREGRPVVVDIKTGKNPPTRAEAERHPQLAVYQLAAALHAFGDLGVRPEPGGARLLYVSKENKKSGATELPQPALDEPAVAAWLEIVRDAAAACTGPEYTATENSDCDRCPARTSCPLHESGRQVGQ